MPRVPPYIIWNHVDGELALFDSRDDRYHALNASAAVLWRGIAAGDAPETIVENVAREYDVDAETIRAALDAFVAQACQAGLLTGDSEG
jgi:hypothetical protein